MLSAANRRQMWIPEGFAHGYVVLSERALFSYLCTAPYDRTADAAIRWDDPALAIDWPVTDPRLSPKDRGAPLLADVAPDWHHPRLNLTVAQMLAALPASDRDEVVALSV